MPLKVIQGPVINDGQSESAVVALGDDFVVGLATPDDWTPAVASIIVSADGDNFFDMFDLKGNEIIFNVVPNTMIQVSSDALLCAAFIKLRSGTRDRPITQNVTRRFFCICSGRVTTREADLGRKRE